MQILLLPANFDPTFVYVCKYLLKYSILGNQGSIAGEKLDLLTNQFSIGSSGVCLPLGWSFTRATVVASMIIIFKIQNISQINNKPTHIP